MNNAYEAKKLTTALDVDAEGTAMGNCVSAEAYMPHIEEGRLLLFAVHGPERLTVRLTVSD